MLFVSDLDCTLLRNDTTLSPFARDTLNGLLAKGLNFTVASARSVSSMRPLLKGLNLRLPVIEFNGAFITDLASGRHLSVCSIETAILLPLFAMGAEASLAPCISTFEGGRDNLYFPPIANPGIDWYRASRAKEGDERVREGYEPQRHLQEQVVCLTYIAPREVLAAFLEGARGEFEGGVRLHLQDNPYFPGWWWLTIHPWSACKSQALKRLREAFCPELGRGPITAFGDQGNDLEMIRAADVGVAVANATPEIREAADLVIGSNQEDAVVRFIADRAALAGARI